MRAVANCSGVAESLRIQFRGECTEKHAPREQSSDPSQFPAAGRAGYRKHACCRVVLGISHFLLKALFVFEGGYFFRV